MSNDDHLFQPLAMGGPVNAQPAAIFSWPAMQLDLPADHLPPLDLSLDTTDAGFPVPALEFPPPPSPEASPVAAPTWPTAANANGDDSLPHLSLDDLPAMDLMDLDRAGAAVANVMPMAFDFTFSFGLPSPPPSFHEALQSPTSPLALATAMPASFLFGPSDALMTTPEPEPEPAQQPLAAPVHHGLHRHARRPAHDLDDGVQQQEQQAANGQDRRKRQRVARARSASPTRVRSSTPHAMRSTPASSPRAPLAGVTSPPLTPPIALVASASSSGSSSANQGPPAAAEPNWANPAVGAPATVLVNGFGLASPLPSSSGDDVASNEGDTPQDAMLVDPVPVPAVPLAAPAPAVALGLPAPPGSGMAPAVQQQQTLGGAMATPTSALGIPAAAPADVAPNPPAGMHLAAPGADAMDVVHEPHHQQQQRVPVPGHSQQDSAPPTQQQQVVAHTTTEQHMQVHESVDTDVTSASAARVALGHSQRQLHGPAMHQPQQATQFQLEAHARSDTSPSLPSTARPAQAQVPLTTTEHHHQSTPANYMHAENSAMSLATPHASPTPARRAWSPATSPSRNAHQRPRPPSVLAALTAASVLTSGRVHSGLRPGVPGTQTTPRMVPASMSSGSGSASSSARVLVAEYERERAECAHDAQQRQQRSSDLSGARGSPPVAVGRDRAAQGVMPEAPAHAPQTSTTNHATSPMQQAFAQDSPMSDAVGRRASDPRDRGSLPVTQGPVALVRLAPHASGVGAAFAAPITVPVPVPAPIALSAAVSTAVAGSRPLSTSRARTHAYLPSPSSSPEPDQVQLVTSTQYASTSVLVHVAPAPILAAVSLRRRPLSPVPADDAHVDQAVLAAVHVTTPPPSPLALGVDVAIDAPVPSVAQGDMARPSSPLPESPVRPQGFSAHAMDVAVRDLGRPRSHASVSQRKTSQIDRFQKQARLTLSSLVAVVSLTLVAGPRKPQPKPTLAYRTPNGWPLPSAHVLASCTFAPANSLPAVALASTTLAALQVMLSPAVTAFVRSLHDVLVPVLVSALVLAAVVAFVFVAVKMAVQFASDCYSAYVAEQELKRRQQQQARQSWYDWLIQLAETCGEPELEPTTQDSCSWTKGASYLAAWFSGTSCPTTVNPASLPTGRRACEGRRGVAPSCATTNRSSLTSWFGSRRESGRYRA